jgi:hypothetical protein
MKIVKGYPPNYPAIARAFDPGPGVVFAYGHVIFAPQGRALSREIVAHEELHGERQLRLGVEAWWARYIASPEFRFLEELLAHQTEFQVLAATSGSPARRARTLHGVAAKLAAPLYGSLCSIAEAKRLILGEAFASQAA